MSDRDEGPKSDQASASGPDESTSSPSQARGPKRSKADRGRALLQLCYLNLAEERLREAVSMMNRAERLGPVPFSSGLAAPQPAIEEPLRRFERAENAKVPQALSSLLDEAQSLLPSKHYLKLAEFFLESGSVGEWPFDDPQWIGQLADRILELLADRMDCAAADARQAREDCQPWLEKTLAALLQAAKRKGAQSLPGQQLLAKAWRVVMSCRGSQLRWAASLADSRRPAGFSEAEQAFYSALRRELLQGRAARPQGWSEPLKRLQESLNRQAALPPRNSLFKPPRQGVSLAFFLFRNLFEDAALLVLASQQGKIYSRLIPQAQTRLIPGLLEWSRQLASSPCKAALQAPWSDLPAQCAAESNQTEKGTVPIKPPLNLQATEKGTVPIKPPLNLQELLPHGLTSQPDFQFSGPWILFPQGIFHALPLEMLPEGRKRCFGQQREVRICLSHRPGKRIRHPVRWGRGWLAVGAVPAAGRIPELEGSLDEVQALESLLRKKKLPAETLAGPQAHLTNLKRRLREGRHSVLHMAAHGYSDAHDPEACTLVLAGIPGVGQSELLPFGLIKRMNLRQLDLVVLSASSGPEAGMYGAAGMEGLTGAFLKAGAGQVIARRYPVDPKAAQLFLLSLYRQLLKRPAALALGYARHECLSRLGLGRQEVGAWSIWI